MLLDVRTRQRYLKELGYYTTTNDGKELKIDGIEGTYTKLAYLKLQKDYFSRATDIDGKYGKDTDILLKNVYKCRNLKHFKLKEFKCKCKGKYCTGYPVELNDNLINYLEATRTKFNKAIKITSGLRCEEYNDTLKGSSKTSRHMSGKAADIKVSGYILLNKRKEVIDHWIEKYSKSRYAYCNKYSRTKTTKGNAKYSNMGTCIHVDVK